MKDRIHVDQMLVAYVDGELDAAAAAEVERLIAEDLKIRADVEMFRQTAMLLRAACGEQNYALAPGSRSAIVSRRRPEWRVFAIAAGVVLAAGCFGAGFAARNWFTDPVIDDVAEYHAVFSRETTRMAELTPDRAGELVAWLGARLGRRLAVPDLNVAGLRFAGGRMLVIGGEPAADFLYTRDRGAPVAVCVVRGNKAPAAVRIVERDDLRVAAWSEGGYTFLVVGDLDAPTARRLANIVASQLES